VVGFLAYIASLVGVDARGNLDAVILIGLAHVKQHARLLACSGVLSLDITRMARADVFSCASTVLDALA
jgi:hypothetical protein